MDPTTSILNTLYSVLNGETEPNFTFSGPFYQQVGLEILVIFSLNTTFTKSEFNRIVFSVKNFFMYYLLVAFLNTQDFKK